MNDDEAPSLISILDRFRIAPFDQPILARFDTDATIAKVQHLTIAAVYVNAAAVGLYGGRPGPVRAPGLVEQVMGAAFQVHGGVDPHPLVRESSHAHARDHAGPPIL